MAWLGEYASIFGRERKFTTEARRHGEMQWSQERTWCAQPIRGLKNHTMRFDLASVGLDVQHD